VYDVNNGRCIRGIVCNQIERITIEMHLVRLLEVASQVKKVVVAQLYARGYSLSIAKYLRLPGA
jgi:hypothetical protein